MRSHPPYNAKFGVPSRQVSLHAPFPAQVPPGTIHRLFECTNYVDIPLASSIHDWLLQRQPDEQDQPPGDVSCALIAAVGVDELFT